jgi:anti-anti-sigma regulatory factor
VRRHGVIAHAGGFGPRDHVCWAFDDAADFRNAAVDFLADGLHLGQRLVYVNEGSPEVLAHHLRGLGPIDDLLDRGALVVCPLDEFCDPTVGVTPERQLALCDQQVTQALADGFTGVRFAAQVTRLAAEPLSWLNHARWEQLADSYMNSRPLSALCGYNREVVGQPAMNALSAVHPLRGSRGSPFGLFVLDGQVWVEGELDALQARVAHELMASIPVDGDDVVVNVSRLGFADGAATGELAQFARHLSGQGRHVVLRDASPMLRRVWELLDLSSVAPVEFAA